jgi:enoyl-CoA hydratase/carnithine racemase
MPKPVIAMLHGSALGGALEIAFSALYRVALRNTTLGFPEVLLGLIPGAGGTQRLPRLIGVGPALKIMMGGDRIDANTALALGLIDRLVTGADPLSAALTAVDAVLTCRASPHTGCDRHLHRRCGESARAERCAHETFPRYGRAIRGPAHP